MTSTIGIPFLSPGQIEAMRPRVTFSLAHLWRVRRPDLVELRFASHDKWIRFRDQDYQPIGPMGSDLEQTEAGGQSDFEIVGFLSAESIRASDIQAQRYDGASVEHWVVDWQRPWIWFRHHRWWVMDVDDVGGTFRAKVQGVEHFLDVPVGGYYERECAKTLGSVECGATPVVTFGCTVEAVATTGAPVLGIPHRDQAFTLTAASWPTVPRDGLVVMGTVYWTTGPNKGTSQEVAGHVGRALSLETATPFPIRAGDRCDIYSGCDGSLPTCTNDYNNRINFGGIFRMPSTEDTYRKPSET